jgi:hypothetical protein
MNGFGARREEIVQMPENNASIPEAAEPDIAAPAGTGHVETTISVMNGEAIRIYCDCALGRDHRYEEWVARFGPTRLIS